MIPFLDKINLKVYRKNQSLVFMRMIKVYKKLNKIFIKKTCQVKYQQKNFWEFTVEINRHQIIKYKSKTFQEMLLATYLLK